MVNDMADSDFVTAPGDGLAQHEAALIAAHAQAVAELNRLRDKASVDESATDSTMHYSLHEVSGVGRYVIPRRTGWKALIDIIHDPVPNIDFSANIYPAFDGIVGERFQSPHFLDPLDDNYESRSYFSLHPGRKPYEDLRDNVAAVRNFLLQSYYTNTPEGMTPEKARKALAEIAAFVGDGLYNNWRFLNIIPNHKPGEPFIDLAQAQAPGGAGAQYIYKKILEHQRHSSWLRPFDAVIALFGGKAHPDWKLPPASDTHFTDWRSVDIVEDAPASGAPNAADIEAAAAQVAAAEACLADIRGRRTLGDIATDLDSIGNHLLYTAQNMQGVAHISEPVRRDAVEIAKDILRKLKISIGDLNVIGGLKLQPSDDIAVLGAVKGVATVYERLLAWARGNNDAAILQHPSVMAATQAIGQLGYLAKVEALRMAKAAGNSGMAGNINEQLKRIPESYSRVTSSQFGVLLDTIEHGIDTVINRIQEVSVSGAKIGKSVDNRGTSMDAPPTAGMANQVGSDEAAQRNAQLITAQQLALMAQQQRAKQATQQPSQPSQGQTSRNGVASSGRGPQQARTQQQRPAASTSSTSTTAPNNALQDAQRKAANFAATRAQHEAEEHHHHDDLLRQQQMLLNQQKLNAAAKAKAAAVAAKIDTNMIKGFKSATDLKGVTGAPITGGRPIDPKSVAAKQAPKPATTPAPAPSTTIQAATTTDDKLKNPFAVQPPPPVPPQGRGR